MVNGRYCQSIIKRDLKRSSTPFVVSSCPRKIDENLSHYSSGDAKKVGPIVPTHSPRVYQSQVRFVDQRSRLQCVSSTLASHVRPCQSPQFDLDQRDQLLERSLFTIIPG